MNVDANVSKCTLMKNHVGYDTIVNVCTGKSYDVSWTGVDWFNTFMLVAVILGMMLLIGWVALSMMDYVRD